MSRLPEAGVGSLARTDPTDSLQFVVDMFGDVYLRLAPDGVVVDCIVPATGPLSISRDDLLGRKLVALLPEHLADAGRRAVCECHASSKPVTLAFGLRTRSGYRALEARLVGMPDGETSVMVRDATVCLRREQKFRQSEVRLRRFLEKLPLGLHVWTVEADGRVTLQSANPAADAVLGMSHDSRLGMDLSEAFPPCERSGMRDVCRRIAAEGGEYRHRDFEYRDDCVTGVFDVLVFQTAPGEVAALFNEVSDRALAQEREIAYRERLRALAAEMGEIEDRERRRLAEELHDRAAQAMAVSRMYLRRAQSDDGHDAEALERAITLLDEATREVRALVTELFPPVLKELGLGSAVRWLCEQGQALLGLDCRGEVDLRSDYGLSDHHQLLVFRAVRELLCNVKKHANATCAVVTLAVEDDTLVLSVEDDGQGFGSEDIVATDGGGFGLFSLRERAGHLGGALTVEHTENGGSLVMLRVPCV